MFPGFEFSSWNGFSVPAGTPEEIVAAIRTEITALAKTPELQERLIKLGIVPGGLSKEETAAVFRKDKENFAASVKAAGIRRRSRPMQQPIASSSSVPGRSG